MNLKANREKLTQMMF